MWLPEASAVCTLSLPPPIATMEMFLSSVPERSQTSCEPLEPTIEAFALPVASMTSTLSVPP